MKKIYSKLYLALLAITIATPSFSSTSLAYGCIEEDGVIKVSGHAFFPPIGWHSLETRLGPLNKKYKKPIMQGFGKKFMSQFLDDLGVENYKYVYKGTLQQALEAAEKGKIDIVFGITHMSDPLLGVQPIFPSIISSPIVAIIPADKELKLEHKEDLIGIKGISSKTDLFGESFPIYVREFLTVYKAKTTDEAFEKLLEKDSKYKYMMASYYFAHAEAIRLGIRKKIKFIPVHLQDINLFIAISKRSSCLNDKAEFVKLLTKKYNIKTDYDKGIRKIIREAMFEWEQYNDTYRFDPDYQTIKDVNTDFGTSKDAEKEYREKWEKIKSQGSAK